MLTDNFNFVFYAESGTVIVPAKTFFKSKTNSLIAVGEVRFGTLNKEEVLKFKNLSGKVEEIQLNGAPVEKGSNGEIIGLRISSNSLEFKEELRKIGILK